jgi:hypothetical protein
MERPSGNLKKRRRRKKYEREGRLRVYIVFF